jgi:hypothetical protein
MTIAEVCQELRSECQTQLIYVGIMPQSSFAWTLGRIERGEAKMCTIKEFFGRFGYIGDWNEWQRAFSIPAPMSTSAMAVRA